ncbi:MAG: sigma-70 family RNA polymerase sigma factor [Candidatus Peribacteria bacterium]|nr:MAG: sigma-70 family RNA polymerase sigma factor [Candidatus Peribacteria bacterium]
MLNQLENQERWRKIEQCLLGFSEEQRQVLSMRLRDQLSYEEIAVITGTSPNACKQLYYRTIKQLTQRCLAVLVVYVLL